MVPQAKTLPGLPSGAELGILALHYVYLPGTGRSLGAMKTHVHIAQVLGAAALLAALPGSSAPAEVAPANPAPQLQQVAAFPKQQVTGVTVSKSGRVFVNFPFWSDDHTISVAEVGQDGTPQPYPNAEWNAKDGDPAKRFVCVQSVVVDDRDNLWVLDPAAPKMEAVVEGGPKLVQISLATNEVVKTIPFGKDIAPEKSYLNDVRFSSDGTTAYITESGMGAIIVVNLESGKARRLLSDHPSTKAEPVGIKVDDIDVKDPKTGKAPAIHADGIALDKQGKTLYYHALTGHKLYSVSTEDLRNEQLGAQELGALVKLVGETPKPDGMLWGPDGKVYLAALEENAIVRVSPETGNTETVVQDRQLQWPDTLAWGPDGQLYVTTSQIHRMPKYNNGESRQQGPFQVLKMPVNLTPATPVEATPGPQ